MKRKPARFETLYMVEDRAHEERPHNVCRKHISLEDPTTPRTAFRLPKREQALCVYCQRGD